MKDKSNRYHSQSVRIKKSCINSAEAWKLRQRWLVGKLPFNYLITLECYIYLTPNQGKVRSIHTVYHSFIFTPIYSLGRVGWQQGRIKRGQRGQLPRGPRCKGVPRDEIYLFQIKYSFEKFLWIKSYSIQEYNSVLYSYVAWSIRAPNSNWFLYNFDCLPVLVIATEKPINIFGFVQCKYIWFRW